MVSRVEYIWLDGTKPTQQLRSKTRIMGAIESSTVKIKTFPEWSFDGSSTCQAVGNNSDLILKPVYFINDPIRGKGDFLVLCEVFNSDGTEHETNSRAILRKILEQGGANVEPWVGFEQEYTFFNGRTPLGWPDNGFPPPQGPYYCGVGTGRVYGREIVEEHTEACIRAGISIYGINAEVMPGQWEFQVGYRGIKNEDVNILLLSDQLWIARWLLCRIAEFHDISVSFHNKPVTGDWNGSGCHTNFSTNEMRTPNKGFAAIERAVKLLEKKHREHISVYGHALERRLTGEHETCNINEFRYGVADRGASIRVPHQVQILGYGYLEDRRPGANCDSYIVSARLLSTICEIDDSLITGFFRKNISASQFFVEEQTSTHAVS